VERQVRCWTERYLAAKADEVPEIEAAAWAALHMPAESGATLVHNGCRYDNVVLDPADPTRVVAVLDWEMATIGDPLMDLDTTLGYWTDPSDSPLLKAHAFGPTHLPGSLSRQEVVARFAERFGRSVDHALFH